jgi:hypothetical protein
MTKEEVYKKASKLKIVGRSTMTKVQLMRAVASAVKKK